MSSNFSLLLQQLERQQQAEQHVWDDCYRYALPQRAALPIRQTSASELFDSTAVDAVEALAASIMTELVPSWMPWFQLQPALERNELAVLAEFDLEKCNQQLAEFIHSGNLYTALHQALLEVITTGTGCLLLTVTNASNLAPICYRALPLRDILLAENEAGQLTTLIHRRKQSLTSLLTDYPDLPQLIKLPRQQQDTELTKISVYDYFYPVVGGYLHETRIRDQYWQLDCQLTQRRLTYKPFVAFRWLQAAGEVYGRSPVMKVLPEIKTANRVVELSLRNAAIAVSGIWQADDDGILNPDNIKLQPGAIIPKAIGSQGITPLATPGGFDVSQILLSSLQTSIRRGILGEQSISPPPARTATEIIERAARLARLLGTSYNRLLHECLNPLLRQSTQLLASLGLLPPVLGDETAIRIKFFSPLQQAQQQRQFEASLQFLDTIQRIAPRQVENIDQPALLSSLIQQANLPAAMQQVLMHQFTTPTSSSY